MGDLKKSNSAHREWLDLNPTQTNLFQIYLEFDFLIFGFNFPILNIISSIAEIYELSCWALDLNCVDLKGNAVVE